jgi:energy-converting hydrogenase A subunit R
VTGPDPTHPATAARAPGDRRSATAAGPPDEGTPHRIYVTDCEGPLARNDNAQEIAAAFLPHGAELFARLSRYDDLLADVLHRPGYNAGDTLRLLPTFLVAFGVTDKQVLELSAGNVLMVPGAAELLAELQTLLPCFIISTSYTPYIRALCEVVGFPFEHCRCTTLSLDAWRLPDAEKTHLREWAARIVERPIIDIPDGAASLDDLASQDRATVTELDRLFWTEMAASDTHPGTETAVSMVGHSLPVAGELLAAVRPVGGGMKLAALEEIVAGQGIGTDQVMYVGDSITDAPPLAAVREWGGVAVSFNGNGYALAAAEIAAAGRSVAPVLDLARAFAAGGPQAARDLAAAWPAEPGGGVPAAIAGLIERDREALTAASLAARTSVRGKRVARLG